MNFLPKLGIGTLWLWALLAAIQGPARAADLLPASLRSLAARATLRETWPRLRTYARAQTSSEWSGWAYFLAGYQEYASQLYSPAAEDLALAARSGFSLADYATYYQASALNQSGQPQDAAAALENFAARFPGSHLHDQVLTLRCNALLNAHLAQQALEVLQAAPQSRHQPGMALLLAQTYLQLQQPVDAARAFNDVYYRFPTSPEARTAADALHALRQQLGVTYPDPDVSLKMERAEILIKAGRYPDAENEYRALLKTEPSSPMVPYWQLGQAQCFLHQHRSADALDAVPTHYAVADLEAQRLAMLALVHAQQADTGALTQDLAQLETSYALFPEYADALAAAGIFYYRQLNWQEAARAYRRLYELFPQNIHLREDGWRLAWCDYRLGDPRAAGDMRAYLLQFPDAARVPAALYWLGRIQEQQGALAEARALYALLSKRFVHTYYAPQAASRLAMLRKTAGGPAGNTDLSDAPLGAELISVLPPPTIPLGLACLASAPSDAARPALILQALDLKSVEEEYLKGALNEDHPPAELRLLLAQIYAAQNNPAAAMYSAIRTMPAYSQLEFSDLPKEIWDFLFPQAYRQLIERQAHLNNLDPYLVMGLVREESGFSARALSVANARGLMQVLPETAAHSSRRSRTRVAAQRLYNPTYNVRVGCNYLAGLMKDFDHHPEFALAAYNAGDFRVRDWMKNDAPRDPGIFLESIPIPATRSYVEQVLRDAEIYRQLLGGSPRFAQCPQAHPSAPPRAANLRNGDVPVPRPAGH